MTNTIYTIGHSTHTSEEFLTLLRNHEIDVVADVRSSPYSKYNEQFNKEILSTCLKNAEIQYVFLGVEFGARRSEEQCYVDNQAKYDLIAQTEAFKRGLERIGDGVKQHKIALMCSEKDPITCHRTILIARVLKTMDYEIHHILADSSIETMEQSECRMLKELGISTSNLFQDRDELLEDAYAKQSDAIAYKRDDSPMTHL